MSPSPADPDPSTRRSPATSASTSTDSYVPLGWPRPRPIGWMTAVLSVVLYLAGSNIGSGWIVIMAAVLLAGLLSDLATTMYVHRRTQVGGRLLGTSTATDANARVNIRRPDLHTSLQLSTSGDARVVVRGAAGGVAAPVHLRRGHHDTIELNCLTSGPFGLSRASGTVAIATDTWSDPASYPAAALLRHVTAVSGEHTDHSTVPDEFEVQGIRPFTAGDPQRLVHWRATARQGQVMVRQLGRQGDGHPLRIGLATGVWDQHAMDLATTVLRSLADSADRACDVIELVADGRVTLLDGRTARRLAALPPAVGVAPRALDPVHDDGAVTVRIEPGPLRTPRRPDRQQAPCIAVSGPGLSPQVLSTMNEVAEWLRNPR